MKNQKSKSKIKNIINFSFLQRPFMASRLSPFYRAGGREPHEAKIGQES
jgi:hypothetical protein